MVMNTENDSYMSEADSGMNSLYLKAELEDDDEPTILDTSRTGANTYESNGIDVVNDVLCETVGGSTSYAPDAPTNGSSASSPLSTSGTSGIMRRAVTVQPRNTGSPASQGGLTIHTSSTSPTKHIITNDTTSINDTSNSIHASLEGGSLFSRSPRFAQSVSKSPSRTNVPEATASRSLLHSSVDSPMRRYIRPTSAVSPGHTTMSPTRRSTTSVSSSSTTLASFKRNKTKNKRKNRKNKNSKHNLVDSNDAIRGSVVAQILGDVATTNIMMSDKLMQSMDGESSADGETIEEFSRRAYEILRDDILIGKNGPQNNPLYQSVDSTVI